MKKRTFLVFLLVFHLSFDIMACPTSHRFSFGLYLDSDDLVSIKKCIHRIYSLCRSLEVNYYCGALHHCRSCSPLIFFSKKSRKAALYFTHHSPTHFAPKGYVSFNSKYVNFAFSDQYERRGFNLFSLVDRKNLENLESNSINYSVSPEYISSDRKRRLLPSVLFCPNIRDLKSFSSSEILKGLRGISALRLLRSFALLEGQPKTKDLSPYLPALIRFGEKPYWSRYQKKLLNILGRIASQKSHFVERSLQRLSIEKKTSRILLAFSLIQSKKYSVYSIRLLKKSALEEKDEELRLMALKALTYLPYRRFQTMQIFLKALQEKEPNISYTTGRYMKRILLQGLTSDEFIYWSKIINPELHWSMISFLQKQTITIFSPKQNMEHFSFAKSFFLKKRTYPVRPYDQIFDECVQQKSFIYLMRLPLFKIFPFYLSLLTQNHTRNLNTLTTIFSRKGVSILPYVKKALKGESITKKQKKYIQILLFLLIEEQREKQALSLLLSLCDEILPEHVDSFLRIFGMIRDYGLWPVFHPKLERCFLHHLQKHPRKVLSHLNGLEKHLFFAVPKLLNWLYTPIPKEQSDWLSQKIEKIALLFGKRSLPFVQSHLDACKSSLCKEKVQALLRKIKENNKKATQR